MLAIGYIGIILIIISLSLITIPAYAESYLVEGMSVKYRIQEPLIEFDNELIRLVIDNVLSENPMMHFDYFDVPLRGVHWIKIVIDQADKDEFSYHYVIKFADGNERIGDTISTSYSDATDLVVETDIKIGKNFYSTLGQSWVIYSRNSQVNVGEETRDAIVFSSETFEDISGGVLKKEVLIFNDKETGILLKWVTNEEITSSSGPLQYYGNITMGFEAFEFNIPILGQTGGDDKKDAPKQAPPPPKAALQEQKPKAIAEQPKQISETKKLPETGGGCLIATATFGSELAPQVQMLREIRDNSVLSTSSGTIFMTTFNQIYYSFSPTIADWERENPFFKQAVKAFITPMISTLSILTLAEEGSEYQILGLGISIIALNLGMYFVIPAVSIIKVRKWFKRI